VFAGDCPWGICAGAGVLGFQAIWQVLGVNLGGELKWFSAKMADGRWSMVNCQVPENSAWAHITYWGPVKAVKASNGEEARQKMIIKYINPAATF
jgi:hypothetical protein